MLAFAAGGMGSDGDDRRRVVVRQLADQLVGVMPSIFGI